MSTLILEAENYSPDAIELYERIGPVTFGLESASVDDVRQLVVRLGYMIDSDFLGRFPSLRTVITSTTGLNHIDLTACRQRSIEVFSLNDCKDDITTVTSTSELTLGLIIALLRQIPQANNEVRSGGWDRNKFRSRQLSNLSIGIVGMGRIGGHLAGYARSLGLQVHAFDPGQPSTRFRDVGAIQASSIHNMVATVDIVSIHASLDQHNIGLVSSTVINAMSPGSYLVNTARGELLDEQAAAEALRSGHLSGIAVDVLQGEHTGAHLSSPLFDCANEGLNIIITPHIGGCTVDAMQHTEYHIARCFVESSQL